jgi:hypothetical protein
MRYPIYLVDLRVACEEIINAKSGNENGKRQHLRGRRLG